MKEKTHDMFFGSWYNLDDGSGIYAIVNSLNNKKYIGSTGTLRKRFRQHYTALSSNQHANCHLQNAVNQYDLQGNFIATHPSINDAARFTGNINHRVSIKRCCYNKMNTAYGFIWKFKEQL